MEKVSLSPSNDFCPQTLFLYGTKREDDRADFGLFCWISYTWDDGLGVMACIGGDKLTKDRIRATGVFSANLVTEKLLPLADYLGNTEGYSPDKMEIDVEIGEGPTLGVPVLVQSPWVFELEVTQTVPLHGGEVYLCKVRNVLADKALADVRGEENRSAGALEEALRVVAPVRTTCSTYFSWDGRALGAWGEPMKAFLSGEKE